MKSCLFVFVILFACVYCGSDAIVYEMHDDNYEGLIARHDPLVVYYTTSELSQEEKDFLEQLTSITSVSAVNCKKNEYPCLDHRVSVKSCPRIAIADKKSVQQFKGEISNRDEVIAWVNHRVLGFVNRFTSRDDLKNLESGNWFVRFTSDFCTSCKETTVNWATTSLVAKGTSLDVTLVDINCSREEFDDFCKENNIKRHPNIKLFVDGEVKETYNDDIRNIPNNIKFLEENLGIVRDEL
mmetsp:Transcript_1056/g.1690  ORF Transcript_1056/g.1690 Transcript_1056/m.1690 type:complete len:240 (+) Transcript_1056:31-750(+)